MGTMPASPVAILGGALAASLSPPEPPFETRTGRPTGRLTLSPSRHARNPSRRQCMLVNGR
eukprot:scaffold50762_cov58-Phaeocystis_antarctica.AAC.2